ncbi:uncharacterized protein LOC134670869 [Cydia fagiglandana]|uniref:uncharacterized protein LOC134670869 n=1 Tax=Cydia fagiglandana TaxID=1458189 RepID=UPI002FEE28DF
MFHHIDATSLLLLLINRALVNLRFHIELAVINCTLCTLSEQLRCIIRSIKKEQAIDSSTSVTIIKDENDVENSSKNLNQWLHNLLQLLRVILNQPINIKTFGVVNVNMTLVPACVGLIVSYTVVALQFNNVV